MKSAGMYDHLSKVVNYSCDVIVKVTNLTKSTHDYLYTEIDDVHLFQLAYKKSILPKLAVI